jgi:signal recognition particle subunit SRP54
MAEITALHTALQPAETLFVVDAMLGQDAVNTAKAFNDALPLTGVVLTKLDGDARGGAALSVRQITGKPVKFVGVSEKLDGLEVFHPERIANRILGQGDLLTLAEQAQRGIDAQSKQLVHKVKKGGRFDLNDFQAQLAQMKKMGGLSSLFDKFPAQFQLAQRQSNLDQAEKQMRRMAGMIHSMTAAERAQPELIKASRKRRIAAGAGVQVQEVNRMLTQFEHMRAMTKKLRGGNLTRIIRSFSGLSGLR